MRRFVQYCSAIFEYSKLRIGSCCRVGSLLLLEWLSDLFQRSADYLHEQQVSSLDKAVRHLSHID